MGPDRGDELLRRALRLEAGVVGAPQEGRDAARQVLADAKRDRHVEATVVALRSLGHAGRLLGEYDEATGALDAAARMARRHRLDERLSEVLITRAAVRLEQGRTRDAARDLAVARGSTLRTSAVELEFLQGRLDEEVGCLDDAVASYRRALKSADEAAPALRLKILNNLAILEGELGRTGEAERLLLDGLAIATMLGPAAEGLVTHNLAWLALRRSDVVDALRRFDSAEVLLAAGGFPLTEHELDRLEALLTMRLAQEGLDLAERVVAALRDTGNDLALAQALLKQANLMLLEDRPTDAARCADEARTRFARQRRLTWAARAASTGGQARLAAGGAGRRDVTHCRDAIAVLEGAGHLQEAADAGLVLARLLLALGDDTGAIAALERIAAAPGGPLEQRLRGWLAKALLAQRRGDGAGVARAAERGLRELETYRATLGSTELRALASGHGRELADLGLGAAIASRRTSRVFSWIERAKVRSLLTPTPPRRDPALATALAERRLLEQRIDDADDLEVLETARRRVEDRARRLARLAPGPDVGLARPLDGRAVRRALGERVLVEIGVHDAVLTAVVVTARGMRRRALAPLPVVQEELGYLLAALRRLGLAHSSTAAAERAHAAATRSFERLDALLVGPAGIDAGDGPVVICPPASLLVVPWGSLPSLRRRPVTVAPAAGMWLAAERRAQARPPGGHVLLAGGPRLASAPAEVAAVAALYPHPTVLTPSSGTVAAVLAGLDGSAVAHLACHAGFRRDNPMFSSLELADGSLVVHDIEALEHPPALLVLAGCDSGQSETYPGEELVGFLSVLLAGGTDSVIASIVPVPDLETAPLMTRFHEGIVAGQRPATALMHASDALRRRSAGDFLAAAAFNCFGTG